MNQFLYKTCDRIGRVLAWMQPEPWRASNASFGPWVIPALMAAFALAQKHFAKNNTVYEQGHPLFPGSEPSNKAKWEQIMGYPWGGSPPGSGGGGGGGSTSDNVSTAFSRTISDVTQQPFLTDEYKGIGNSMKQIMAGRLKNGSSVPAGYFENQVAGINDTYGSMQKVLANKLTSMGAAGTPEQVAAGEGYLQAGRGRDIAAARANLPVLARSMQNEDVGMAAQLAQTFGLGHTQHTDSTTDGRSTSNTVSTGGGGGGGGGIPIGAAANMLPQAFYESHAGGGGGASDIFGSLAGLLGMLYGSGMFGGKKTTQAPAGGGWNYGPSGPPPTNYGYG